MDNTEQNENLQVKAYRIAYDQAITYADDAYTFESKERWVAQAVKYALLIEKVCDDMPKADKRYLFKRGGETWWVKLRVSGTDKTIRKSLKTKDLKEAQARRDKILQQRERLAENQSYRENKNGLV
jgi:phosphomannomutase